jgi:hypothetical protein
MYDFSATNMTGTNIVIASNARSFIEGIDIARYLNKVESTISTILMPEITKNGLIDLEVFVHTELLTETTISVSLNGYPPVVFRFPTFADSLYVPVISDPTNKTLFSDDMGIVLDTVTTVSNGANSNIDYTNSSVNMSEFTSNIPF